MLARNRLLILFLLGFGANAFSQALVDTDTLKYAVYPEVNQSPVQLPSPFITPDGETFIVALTRDSLYAIIPVSLSNDRGICPQLIVDTADFPDLATTGLHDPVKLASTTHITGRSMDEITALARPGGLSYDGFIAMDESVLPVMIMDNKLVADMQLTHPEMATCLFYVLNLMDADLELNRWNMAHHEWEHLTGFWYNDHFLQLRAFDTKGGQQSIFDDGIMGAFHIRIWRELSQSEQNNLDKYYGHLDEERFSAMLEKLSTINTGEMEPQYIMRYGFYEGHTYWRADPLAIAFIFGLRSLEELPGFKQGKLDKYLLDPFIQ